MNIPFYTEYCFSCGIPFDVTQRFHDERLRDKQNFYCPSGHNQHYTGDTEVARLKKMLEEMNSIISEKNERLEKMNSIISEKNERLEKMNRKLPKKYRDTI